MEQWRLLTLCTAWVCISALFSIPAAAANGSPAKNLEELATKYDSSGCRECHEEVFDQWANSPHAISAFGSGGGRTAATFVTAIERGFKLMPYSGVKEPKDVRKKHMMGCAKCHLPQLSEASEEAVQEFVGTLYTFLYGEEEEAEKAGDILQELNIGCLICHNYKAVTHKWVDGPIDPKAVYGSRDGEHEHDVYSIMKKSPIMNESLLCGQCHGQGPNLEMENPTQCATLYGSYLFSYIPEGGKETCQECHMRKSGLGHEIKTYTSEAMYKEAVDVNVESQALYWRKDKKTGVIPIGVVEVDVTNKAGHVIPDG